MWLEHRDSLYPLTPTAYCPTVTPEDWGGLSARMGSSSVAITLWGSNINRVPLNTPVGLFANGGDLP